jgi:hypothetical protein
MTSSSHIHRRLVGTTTLGWNLLWMLLLFQASPGASHRARWTINECDRKDMPTVVLAKEKNTGLFTVLKRYAPGEQIPPLNEWTLDPNSRHLERSNDDFIPSPIISKGQPGGLRLRQPKDPFPGLDSTDPQVSSPSPSLGEKFDFRDDRFLEAYPSSNFTLSDILENFDLFYAR